MLRPLLWLAAGICFEVGICAAAVQDAKSVLQNASKTLGNPNSLQFSGTGMNALFGQALTAGKEWPRRDLERVTESINYNQRSARVELVFQKENFQGIRQNTQVNGDRAWTVRPNGVNPQLGSAEERQLQIWMTPHGFVRAGLAASKASLRSRMESGKRVSVISFPVLGKYELEGVIDDSGRVVEVRTKFPNPMLGDMPYRFVYSDYAHFDDIEFPRHIVQSEGGFPVNDLTIASVKANAAVDIPVPAEVQSAAAPKVQVLTSKIGDGIWFAGGGSHHSVIVEFDKFITVIEAPQNEARSLAVIEQAKALAGNKPIRYVVNTHHHFDHAGGLRTYVAEGATVITDASNKTYFERSFAAPATLVPDTQAKARRKPMIQTVADRGKYVISDGKQSIEVYGTRGDSHTDELLFAYLPSAKVLVEADSFAPGPGNELADEQALNRNIEQQKLEVLTIVGIHGSGPVPFEEFKKDLLRGQ